MANNSFMGIDLQTIVNASNGMTAYSAEPGLNLVDINLILASLGAQSNGTRTQAEQRLQELMPLIRARSNGPEESQMQQRRRARQEAENTRQLSDTLSRIQRAATSGQDTYQEDFLNHASITRIRALGFAVEPNEYGVTIRWSERDSSAGSEAHRMAMLTRQSRDKITVAEDAQIQRVLTNMRSRALQGATAVSMYESFSPRVQTMLHDMGFTLEHVHTPINEDYYNIGWATSHGTQGNQAAELARATRQGLNAIHERDNAAVEQLIRRMGDAPSMMVDDVPSPGAREALKALGYKVDVTHSPYNEEYCTITAPIRSRQVPAPARSRRIGEASMAQVGEATAPRPRPVPMPTMDSRRAETETVTDPTFDDALTKIRARNITGSRFLYFAKGVISDVAVRELQNRGVRFDPTTGGYNVSWNESNLEAGLLNYLRTRSLTSPATQPAPIVRERQQRTLPKLRTSQQSRIVAAPAQRAPVEAHYSWSPETPYIIYLLRDTARPTYGLIGYSGEAELDDVIRSNHAILQQQSVEWPDYYIIAVRLPDGLDNLTGTQRAELALDDLRGAQAEPEHILSSRAWPDMKIWSMTEKRYINTFSVDSCAICLSPFRWQGNPLIEHMSPTQRAELDSIGDRSKVRQLPCGHTFHVQCARGWSHQRMTCPLCNRAFTRRDIE